MTPPKYIVSAMPHDARAKTASALSSVILGLNRRRYEVVYVVRLPLVVMETVINVSK